MFWQSRWRQLAVCACVLLASSAQPVKAWSPLDPFGSICASSSFPAPSNLDICEFLIEQVLVPPIFREEITCGDYTFPDPRLADPFCLVEPACYLYPHCLTTQTVTDIFGYIYYYDEIECSPNVTRTVTELVEDVALQQLENIETLTVGGLNSVFYGAVSEHLDLIECNAQELSPGLKDVMRRMRDRVGFDPVDSFADVDLDTMRISSPDNFGADVYLQTNRAITLGHLVILEQRPPDRPMWDILSNWTRTWDDVINGRLCPQERDALDLILHEAVHVRQYRNLGKESFINQYLPDILISNSKEAEAYTFAASALEADITGAAPDAPDFGAVRLELDAIALMFGLAGGCTVGAPPPTVPGGPLATTPASGGNPGVTINSICGSARCAPALLECDQPHAATLTFNGTATDPDGIASTEWFIPLAGGTRTTLGNGPVITNTMASQSPGVSGRYRINFSATDSGGRVGLTTTVINVRDTTEPAITMNAAPAMYECNVDAYTEAGATAADVCDPAVSGATPFGTVDTSAPGSYTVTYLSADDVGNIGSATRTVAVVDTTIPTIQAPPEVVTQSRFPALGTAIATDLCTASPLIFTDAPVQFPYGTTVVTWWSVDDEGNESLRDTQVVTVIGGDGSTAGRDFTCGLSRDGEVFCWGANGYGQLGDGASDDRWGPMAINMVGTASQVTVGPRHACALKGDGSVDCWGRGQDGRLGNGSTSNSAVPVPVSGLTNVQQVSAGGRIGLLSDDGHTCAVVDGGSLRCWGEGDSGQLGDGLANDSSTPIVTTLPGGTPAVQVSAGGQHTCAIDFFGQAFCWGEGGSGRLGTDSTSDRDVPTQVVAPGGVVFTQVDAGEQHTCAVDSLGSVWCWGEGANGRLGINSFSDRDTPAAVTLPGSAVQVSAGSTHTCAVLTDGTVHCWGSPFNGRLGDGVAIFDQLVPVQAAGVTNAVAVAAGFDHTCARTFDGAAYSEQCWGSNGNGELGDGTNLDRATAVEVATLCRGTGFFPMAAGVDASCAVTLGASEPADFKCWGSNGSGRIGDGGGVDRRAPTPAVGTGNASMGDAGGEHTCAVTQTGAVACWGGNLSGQLGDGTIFSRSTPTLAADTATYSMVATGGDHTCGIVAGGQVKCWGQNLNGQVGDGSIFNRLEPTAVAGLPGAAMWITAGDRHSCAVVQNGGDREVWCWGQGLHGKLGHGTFFDSWAPVRAGTLSDAWVVSAGEDHTCATTLSGPVYCWGHSLSGQVGAGSLLDSFNPVQVVDSADAPLSAPFAFIGAGRDHTCVAPVGALQQAACWGSNVSGQLGNGTFLLSSRADLISGMPFVASVAAGQDHTCASLSSGDTMCWGANDQGQLGDGTDVPRNLPVRVAGACY